MIIIGSVHYFPLELVNELDVVPQGIRTYNLIIFYRQVDEERSSWHPLNVNVFRVPVLLLQERFRSLTELKK